MNVRRLVVFGISVALVSGMVAVSWSVRRWERMDEAAVSEAIAGLMAAESFSGGLSVDTFIDPGRIVPDSGWGSLDLPVRISGPMSVGPAGDGSLLGQGTLGFYFGGGNEPFVTSEVRLTGGDGGFLRLQGLPSGGDGGFDVGGLNGTWFSVGADELSALLPWLKDGGNAAELPPDTETADRGPWLRPSLRLADTVIDGRPVLHYELEVSRDGLAALVAGISARLTGERPTSEHLASASSFISRYQVVSEGFVDRQLGEFRVLKFGLFPLDGQDASPVALTMKFDRFGESVLVETPADARPLSSSLRRLLSGGSAAAAVESR
ncbi:MAG: hypothetical protein ABIJ46_01540 [bacterium]